MVRSVLAAVVLGFVQSSLDPHINMKFIRFLTLFFGFVAVASLATAAQALAPNSYRVASTQGTALWLNGPSGQVTVLAAGQKLPEGAIISTQENSRVVLAFSTGATAVVGEKSEVVVSKFSQQAFDAASVDYATSEPSVSATELTLNKGTVTSKVSKLKAGSSFEVKTAVGAAGVRGTAFEVRFDPIAKVLEIRTAEGLVVFTNEKTNAENPVEGGKKIVVSFETGPDDELIVGSVVLGDLTADEIAVILSLLTEVGSGVLPTTIINVLDGTTILSDDGV